MAKTRSQPVGPSMAGLFTIVFALGGWRSGLSRLSDNSFFWHLRTGRRLLEHGVPHADPYSFTASGTRWVAQSWLAEALYGAVDRAAGTFGLRLLVATTGALVAGLTYRLVLGLSRDRMAAIGLTLAAIGASFTLWAARPLFLGLLALIGLLWIVEVPRSWLGRRTLWTVPGLMWLWVNTHGTFALGFLYLGLHLAGRWLDGAPPWRGRERRLSQAVGLALAVSLVNPYGPGLLLFPVHLLGRGDILRNITEWRSPDIHTVQGLMFAAWLVVFLACVTRGRSRVSRRDLVVSVPFVLLAFWAQRNILLAPLVGVTVAARAVARDTPRPDSESPLNRVVAAALLALGLVWTVQAAGRPDLDLERYPVDAMRYVADHDLLGHRLMTDDVWGGYLILEYWPRQKVFVDDRYDMYPIPVLRDFIRFADADGSWHQILDHWGIDVVVWPRGAAIVRRMEADPGWKRVHEDTVATVLVRTPVDSPAPAPAAAPAPPAAARALQPVLDRFVAAQTVPFSVVAADRAGDVRAAHLADRQVLSASLYKLFVGAELLRQVHDGVLSRDSVAGDGSGRTVGACIRDMIVVSDNRCGAWGLRQLGDGRMDSELAREGFSGTSLASPQRTTATDVARFFERARDGTLLGPGREAATGELYGFLRDQQVNDRLPVGLPPGTPVAHKTGDRLHWAHDGGIITTPGGELLLVVLTGPWPPPCCDADHPGAAEARAFGAIADLARQMYAASG
ncbi:MAG TPA: serine hydrolase [Acidimicrobiia bacterium]|nr:serine hydrolase [Acidimicrobiia bacterium]